MQRTVIIYSDTLAVPVNVLPRCVPTREDRHPPHTRFRERRSRAVPPSISAWSFKQHCFLGARKLSQRTHHRHRPQACSSSTKNVGRATSKRLADLVSAPEQKAERGPGLSQRARESSFYARGEASDPQDDQAPAAKKINQNLCPNPSGLLCSFFTTRSREWPRMSHAE